MIAQVAGVGVFRVMRELVGNLLFMLIVYDLLFTAVAIMTFDYVVEE